MVLSEWLSLSRITHVSDVVKLATLQGSAFGDVDGITMDINGRFRVFR